MATKRDNSVQILRELAASVNHCAELLEKGKVDPFKYFYSSTVPYLVKELDNRYRFEQEEPLPDIRMSSETLIKRRRTKTATAASAGVETAPESKEESSKDINAGVA